MPMKMLKKITLEIYRLTKNVQCDSVRCWASQVSQWYRICLQCRRPLFNSWVGKILWRRVRLPTPVFLGFPGGSDGKRICLQCGRPGSDPWVGEIPWRREPLPTPVFLPRECHGQRTLVGYSPWGHKESDPAKQLSLSLFMYKINNKDILCSTENCSHYLVITCKAV